MGPEAFPVTLFTARTGEVSFIFCFFGASNLSRILNVFSSNGLLSGSDETKFLNVGFDTHVGEKLLPTSVIISSSHSCEIQAAAAMSSSAGKLGCVFSSAISSFTAGGGCLDACRRGGFRELGVGSLGCVFSSAIVSFSAGLGFVDACRTVGFRELGVGSLEIVSALFGHEIDLETHF